MRLSVSFTQVATLGAILGPQIPYTKRITSLEGLYSHIYDVKENWSLIQTKRKVDTNQVGVHYNE